jgi:hypothetical protein
MGNTAQLLNNQTAEEKKDGSYQPAGWTGFWLCYTNLQWYYMPKESKSTYGLGGVADWRATEECLHLWRYVWQCFCTIVLVLILHNDASSCNFSVNVSCNLQIIARC